MMLAMGTTAVTAGMRHEGLMFTRGTMHLHDRTLPGATDF